MEPTRLEEIIDSICDRFEAAWRSGSRPTIEAELASLDGPYREELLRHLLGIELAYRHRLGERLDVEEYRRRFVGETELVNSAFADLAKLTSVARGSSDARADNAAPAVPGYEILGELGRGGMGQIFRDALFDRELAVKVLLRAHAGHPELSLRFINEARISGQLQHPGIVPVYNLGTTTDSRPYFAMKLVKGRTLSDLLAKRASPASELPRFLAIFEQVCQTVAYTHARRVIHRDLKPLNIMVGRFGEVQVMDWGLAKVLPRGDVLDDARASDPEGEATVIARARDGPDDSDLSREGAVLGTPAYMAPEQARGEIDGIDERADVFALGSILCEILTGSPSFLGRKGGEIQRKAARGDLADAFARLDGCGADTDLVSLSRDCLAPEVEDRLRHAGAVCERITAYLGEVRNRLRAAEVARGAEMARAEEASRTAAEANERARAERRARRFQVGMTASLLVLTTIGGLSFTYLLQQQQQRASRRALMFAETSALRDTARREADDPALWRDALDALKRVEDQGSEARTVALRVEIEAGLDGALRDARLRQELVEVRANQQDVGLESTDAAYVAAFRAAGMDVDTLDPHEFARRLKHRPEAVVIELSAFLDDWSNVRRMANRSVAAWRRPIEAARLADPNPYRDRLREILAAEDRRPDLGTLTALATAPEAADLPAATAVLLAGSLADLGKAAEAATLLRTSIVRNPSDVWVNYSLAQILDRLTSSTGEEASRHYTSARALRPETAHQFAHLLVRMNRGGEAEAIFHDLMKRRPDNARHAGCLGIYLKDSGRVTEAEPVLDRAIAGYRKAIRLTPDDPDVHFNLGSILSARGRSDEATAEYHEAIRFRPGYAAAAADPARVLRSDGRLKADDGHASRANALRMQGRLEEAVAEFREAIRLNRDDAELHFNLGGSLVYLGKHDEGAAEIREAFRLQPVQARAVMHTFLGLDLQSKGELQKAVIQHREAIRLKPDFAQAHCNLSDALWAQGKREEAVVELRQVIRLQADHAHAHCKLGNALWHYEKHDEAVAELQEAVRLQPDWAGAHFDFGKALSARGKGEEALAEFREAARLDAEAGRLNDAVGVLGKTLKDLGRPDETIAIYRIILRKSPAKFEARLGLSAALGAAGRHEEAETELQQAIRLAPRNAEAYLGISDVLLTLGKREEAIEGYQRAVTLQPENHDCWRIATVLYVLAGDADGYRRHCRRMLDRFGATVSPEIAERTARACLLLPISGGTVEEASRLAERAESLITPATEWVRDYIRLTRAIADNRSGRFADAVIRTGTILPRLNEGSSKYLAIATLMVRSMALSRLSRQDEAREAFDRGSNYYTAWPIKTPARDVRMDWHDQQCCDLLRQAADGLLLDRAFPADVFTP